MPTPPRSWRDVADPYAKSVQMVERRVQVVRNRNNAKEAEVERSIRALVDKKNKDDNERLIKARNAGSGGLDGMDEDDDDDEPNGEAVLNNRNHIGWLSSEARALFLGSKDADGDVVDILQERIGELTNVVQAVDDYKSVLQSADDDGAELNDHQKWHIAQKAIYLREAYKLKVVNSHRAALDHDRGYLDKIIKEECFDLVRFVVKSESKSLPVKREESSGETSRKSSRKRTKTSRG
ncbi:hypothetical protein THAOC_14402 [Thalassiosira oceanica]|uniref:Uncharacterized protein n=1 Tax=Thalassiosira oceanica TaxID=159749 RepID=K0SUV7_THAOC|nr:hypothetical protein THAOC_14402 [Thalassiosira oceanica]|eukprot:EJK64821.1 hypothetical protein THAOC_14402 [Thalassiosira oceanica]